MRINEIIKEKRNAQGLTQEQVAMYLGVSTPAVNKWEKGTCYPDITLLPALARLLKVDLNTLLSFKEDLSEQEIGVFVNELVKLANNDGFHVAFEKAMDKIYEYPTCDKLILTVSTVMQGSMYMFGADDKEKYEKQIEEFYIKLTRSDDIEIRNQALSMLINIYLGRKEYEKAQGCVDKLPNITYDKKVLQGNIYNKSGEFQKAAEIFEQKLLSATTDIYISLISMLEIALKEGCNEDAKYFAEVIDKTTKLYDLCEYNSYSGYFEVYKSEKDVENFLLVLKKILDVIGKRWNLSKSKLYRHIKDKREEEGFNEQLLSNFVNILRSDSDGELDFLKDNDEFNNLLNTFI
ncbi:helix-turn-helix domain-containing protein [Clostridium perfringens]|uniref:helix-turn-helix domain-containing protein n=1 Tax=Clostridium perfringens TaxID=1502 RepID=UPI001A2FA2D1|nr:helix-turn-helix transcriptional regulator [Clostridium perfringens]EHR0216832.1 helix-turn-helix transcriptional regulator [Clostridium perfringens]EJT6159113.1 helix-turn-helix transcriptional regulator [Clostridium perfringens]MDM0616403.1 helix-turn-helix transcriptional regulator [Clostridium perfringens]MDN4557051.1 helix-turn-helix transcriptional regulator [Clostridium perfringens]MDT7986993.1 helix-turn-helix transcriptional regulator [Clostridium perfringens]